MSMSGDHARFANIGFDDFREMARDESLSCYEKIGFPDSYRKGKEEAIFADVCSKLPALTERGQTILDIGPGCSGLPRMIMQHCEAREHELILVDSAEMLSQLPDGPHVNKVEARFPDCAALMKDFAGRVEAVIAYSVFHYIFREGNTWRFLDSALALLSPGGRMLIGDIPNTSKRKRFLSTEAGVRFHKQFMRTDMAPQLEFNRLEPGEIDDSVVLSIILRARAQGFDAYVLPQPPSLPMANRREDILLSRP
jgi:hypothetical protein